MSRKPHSVTQYRYFAEAELWGTIASWDEMRINTSLESHTRRVRRQRPTRLLRLRRYHHRLHRTLSLSATRAADDVKRSRPDIGPAIGAKTTFGIQWTTYFADPAIRNGKTRTLRSRVRRGIRYRGFDGIGCGLHGRQTENRRILRSSLVILVCPGVTPICLSDDR